MGVFSDFFTDGEIPMSIHLQFQSCVIQLPFQNRYGRNVYLAMAEGGDNNLIDDATNRIVREWYPVALGDALDVMTRIIKGARDCEWGCLRFANQRVTKPENYIRHWRHLLDTALSVEQAQLQGYSYSPSIEVVLCHSQLWKRMDAHLQRLEKSLLALDKLGLSALRRKAMFHDVYPYKDPEVWAWMFDITEQTGWNIFEQHAMNINPYPLRGLRVNGPSK